MVPSAVSAHLTGRRAAAGPDRVLIAWWSHPASATLAKHCNPSLTTVQAESRRRLAKPDRDAPQKLATRLSFGRAGLPSGVASTAGLGLHSALLVRLDVHSPPSCGRSSAAPTRGAAGRPAATPLRLSATATRSKASGSTKPSTPTWTAQAGTKPAGGCGCPATSACSGCRPVRPNSIRRKTSGNTSGRTRFPTACSPTATPASPPGTPSWPRQTASAPSQPEPALNQSQHRASGVRPGATAERAGAGVQ